MSEDRDALRRQVTTAEAAIGFSDQLILWDQVIANSQATEDNKGRKRIICQAVHEMDNLATNELGVEIGDLCAVSGHAFWAETVVKTGEQDALEGNTISGSATYRKHEEDVAGRPGIFSGFFVRKLGDDDHPRLWYGFRLGQLNYESDPLCIDSRIHLMLVDPATAQIVSAEQFEEPFTDKSSEVEVVQGAQRRLKELSRKSKDFSRIISSKAFHRLGHSVQISLVDRLISEAEVTSGIIGSKVAIEAEYGYISRPGPEYATTYEFVNLKEMVLSGVCLALTMPDRQQFRTRPIRSIGDIDPIKRHEGFYLTLEMNEKSDITYGSPLKPKSIVHVPYAGQTLSIMFADV